MDQDARPDHRTHLPLLLTHRRTGTLGGHTRVTQSETFRGILIPFTGKTITQTETDFRNLNQALKQRVEARR